MDKYSIIRKIGQGSFGNVLLIRCKNNRKKYVLKKINLQNLRSEELKATYQEVHLLASLNHPNIVSYKDAFKTKEGYLYIVMVYCDGGDMYTKIKNQKGIYFPEDQIIQWIIQISLALQYLHNKNILHRDLKTQNIFLSKNNVVKIGDFGIAKILDSDDSMANTMIGTPYYMSPELFSKKSYNHKSDVWSLGCCIYEITSLRHAFDARDINSLMHKILRGKLPTMPSHYSFELQELICNLLHLEPEKRPSATKILHSLFIERHVQLFLEVTKTDELISINRTKISGKFHQKNINKTLFNKDKDELILEGQGLNCQMDQQKQIQKNNQFIRTDQDLNETRLPSLIINGQEIKLGNRAFEQDSPKHNFKMEKDNCKNKQDGKKLKPKRISNSNSNQTQTCSNACISAHANETNSDTDSSKLLPSKIEKKLKPASSGLNPYFHTRETCRKNRKGKSRELVQLHKTQEKDKSEEISQITSIINIFDKTFHTAIKSTKNPQISSNDCNDKRLQTEIAHLRHDCANGLGQDVLTEALQLVNQFSSIKLEVGLKRLLGKKNYTNYMGKIWQLKFYEDSVLSTNASK